MAFQIKDPTTDAAVRKLAARRKVSLTAAVRQAVENELARSERDFDGRLDAVVRELKQYPPTGLEADKAFYDELSGDS